MKNNMLIWLLPALIMMNSTLSLAQSDTVADVGYLSVVGISEGPKDSLRRVFDHHFVKDIHGGIHVYDDTSFLGTAPFYDVPLRTGTHILRYLGLEKNDWSNIPVVETLTVTPGDRIIRTLALPFVYHITSEPFGAEIFLNDSLVGVTPCFLSRQSSQQAIKLRKLGYRDENILITEEMKRIHVVLSPSSAYDVNRSYLVKDGSQNDIPIYLTVAATITSGVSAVYFKVKADNIYAEYRKTGNADLVQQIKNYDTISGISLAMSEASLALFTYLLLSR